jgi:hypothetical protein
MYELGTHKKKQTNPPNIKKIPCFKTTRFHGTIVYLRSVSGTTRTLPCHTDSKHKQTRSCLETLYVLIRQCTSYEPPLPDTTAYTCTDDKLNTLPILLSCQAHTCNTTLAEGSNCEFRIFSCCMRAEPAGQARDCPHTNPVQRIDSPNSALCEYRRSAWHCMCGCHDA